MAKKIEAQTEVGVGAGALWKALTKDLTHVLPKAAPNLVKKAEIVEGDGGLGTVILFHYGPDVPHVLYQKEKIVELDETQLLIGLKVIERGHLNHGFTSYAGSFQLNNMGECKTLVNITVAYDSGMEDAALPEKNINMALVYLKCLENYLQKITE